jgi:hypothetical protein
MPQKIQADDPPRRADAVGGSGMSQLNASLALVGAVVLLAAIAFILGATLLT